MKYVILVYDGAADRAEGYADGRTPLEAANKPVLDRLAAVSELGMTLNVPEGMVPESDTANLAVLSYDPRKYSKGRAPLEALAMGLDMREGDLALRCNVVTLGGEGEYETLTMEDHSADEISSAEASELIATLEHELGCEGRHFYPGVSYRHCLIWHDAPEYTPFMRPHDIIGQKIAGYLPCEPYLSLQRRSRELLAEHPVNLDRIRRGLRPANSIWLWSPGAKPALPSFEEKWGLKGAVISAVDLIKGIGRCAGMDTPEVEGATGNLNTNYRGKAEAAIAAFERGCDLVFIHVEAPDECGHRAEAENKVRSIEYIDEKLLAPLLAYLNGCGEPFRLLALPDHPTPVSVRTHTSDPVPYMLYRSDGTGAGAASFTEAAGAAGIHLPSGCALMERLLGRAPLKL